MPAVLPPHSAAMMAETVEDDMKILRVKDTDSKCIGICFGSEEFQDAYIVFYNDGSIRKWTDGGVDHCTDLLRIA